MRRTIAILLLLAASCHTDGGTGPFPGADAHIDPQGPGGPGGPLDGGHDFSDARPDGLQPLVDGGL